MPQFPLSEQLDLLCTFERLVGGRLHPDGQRYLPLALLRLDNGTLLGVTDRHHRLDAAQTGRRGSARLVFLLSTVRLQQGSSLQTIPVEHGLPEGWASTAPTLLGRVRAVPTWEVRRGELPYETLFTEMLVDIGLGVVGLRTTITAPVLADVLGAATLVPGDYVVLRRSRIDILGFVAA
jgi:hypothetical protein